MIHPSQDDAVKPSDPAIAANEAPDSVVPARQPEVAFPGFTVETLDDEGTPNFPPRAAKRTPHGHAPRQDPSNEATGQPNRPCPAQQVRSAWCIGW